MVNAYPQEALAGGRKLSFTKFAAFQYENRARAAEAMRADGALDATCQAAAGGDACRVLKAWDGRSDKESRSEEHTSELQSLMRISYAVVCLKTKKQTPTQQT